MQIAFSPCPNDTFIFYHLLQKTNDISPFPVESALEDVESLNQKARTSFFPFTKLSFAAYFVVSNSYVLLNSGAALGRGCGPLIVKKKGNPKNLQSDSTVLIPGTLTTANLLLSLFRNSNEPVLPVRYEQIIPSLLAGRADFGVLIHEERFTYESLGLEKIVDLGEFWETETGFPIPLGAIVGKRSLPLSDLQGMEDSIRKSLELAYKTSDNNSKMWDYIRQHSQNKSDAVIRSHIELYVNDFSLDLGQEGREAILALRERALRAGFPIESTSEMPLFLTKSA